MFFSIDPHNGVAIYEQLVRQIKFAIADQTLRPGQLLPSVRVLSQQLALNPNTIARALQVLQSDGILESLRGRGLAVRSDSVDECIRARRDLIAERFRIVISEALHAGLEPAAVTELVKQQLGELAGNVTPVSGVAN